MERELHNPPRMEDISDIYPKEGFISYHAMSVWHGKNGLMVGDYLWIEVKTSTLTSRYYLTEWETPFL